MAIHTTIVTFAATKLRTGIAVPRWPVARWVRRPDGHLDCIWSRPGITSGIR